MKINSLELENFGRFREKEIHLTDGINLIYGKNESGKSTVHTFLKGMLFGMARGRGRAAASDRFSRYEPWENPTCYAGKLHFQCGGKNFCLERHFDKYAKGASLFCEDDGEELSLEHGDLEMLLGGIRESDYENTVSIGQLKAAVGTSLAAELKDYAANYYAAGTSEIRIEKAKEALKERKKELERDMKKEEAKKQTQRERIEQEASYIWRDMRRLEKELSEVKEEGDVCKRKLGEKEEEVRCRIEEEEQKGRFDNWRIHPLEIVSMFGAVILSFLLFSRPLNFLVVVVVALAEGLYIWNCLKDGKRKKAEALQKEEKELCELKETLQRHTWALEKRKEDYREKQVQYENLQEQAEELESAGEEYQRYEKRHRALDLAAETICILSGEMQSRLGRDLNERVSDILKQITGGKYEKVWTDEELNIHVLGGGRRIPLYQLSKGTIEQIYLSLRLAAAEILYEERMPLVLDDTFAYYDDARLKNTLAFLADYPAQIIILTCHNREEETMSGLGIPFRKIELV